MATITGTGTPQALASTTAGAGVMGRSGTGAVQATTATAAGLVSEKGEGTLISIYQSIVLIGTGNLIDFEQTIKNSGNSGNLIEIEQTIKTGSGKFSGLLLS